jgi:Sulfotransferase family
MQTDFKKPYTYVFVCGLHRSGTSVLALNIGGLENCTGFKNTPPNVPDEGQNLQDVYPFESEFGGPGKFGFHPCAHLTETSELLTPENVARLRASWHSYWDKRATIFVEKTPGNLLMTRFLQAAFPNSYFVVIRRHPVPVCLGTPRLGQATATSLHRLFEHWLHCHDIFNEDKKFLKHLYELTYEEYIENPGKYHQEIAALIGTRAPPGTKKEVKADRSNKYFNRWRELLVNSPFKTYYNYIAKKYEPRFIEYGYSLAKWPGMEAELRHEPGRISALRGSLFCFGADAYALMRRILSWPPPYIRARIKARLPESVVAKIKQARHKRFLSRKGEVTAR